MIKDMKDDGKDLGEYLNNIFVKFSWSFINFFKYLFLFLFYTILIILIYMITLVYFINKGLKKLMKKFKERNEVKK